MMKYSKALKALIKKADKDVQKLLKEVAAGKLDKRVLEAGLKQVEIDVGKLIFFDHKPDADEESDVAKK